MQKDDEVVLVDNFHFSLLIDRGSGLGHIPIGTVGKIISSRKTPSDKERYYLVKFKGYGSNRHVSESWIERIADNDNTADLSEKNSPAGW